MDDFFNTVECLLHRIESYHDSYTERHEKMTGKLMFHFGKTLGYNDHESHQLSMLGNMHDIGKISIPAKILEKNGELNAFERSVVELHPKIGCQLIDTIKHPFTEIAKKVILNHHEAFDGSGYPNGLKGRKIPIEARICSICDVYEALRSHRPYRDNTLDHENTMEKMLDKRHGLKNKFDPDLLKVFEKLSDQIKNWFSEGGVFKTLNFNLLRCCAAN